MAEFALGIQQRSRPVAHIEGSPLRKCHSIAVPLKILREDIERQYGVGGPGALLCNGDHWFSGNGVYICIGENNFTIGLQYILIPVRSAEVICSISIPGICCNDPSVQNRIGVNGPLTQYGLQPFIIHAQPLFDLVR